jgi:hypothetical protein
MVEKNKVIFKSGNTSQGNSHNNLYKLPPYVELALSILEKAGSSPVNALTVEEQTTLNKYAYWCVNHLANQIEQNIITTPKYTRKQVASIFRISLPTLDKYMKLGLIQSVRFRNRILFSDASVQDARQGIDAVKYQHLDKKP